MLTSIAIIFLTGLIMGGIFKKLSLPGLIGMIIAGIIISPNVLNLVDKSVMDISADLRRIALVIILTRAGLSLDMGDLKKVGRPAILMCFVPACFEMAGTVLIAPFILGISRADAAIMGSVLAAVSPAIIVPRMIKLIEEGRGSKNKIPQLILAGASADDIFVIVAFSVFTSAAQTGNLNGLEFLKIPLSVFMGILLGIITGFILAYIFKKINMSGISRIIVLISTSFLLLQLEKSVEHIIPISSLISIMVTGIVLKRKIPDISSPLAQGYNKLWSGAEIMLFVLVGTAVDLKYAAASCIPVLSVTAASLVFRMAGVLLCLAKTPITHKERIFCMIAYIPKATVQAAIGAVPLSMGLSCGSIVLTSAVLSILTTAPLGAIGIDKLYNRLLDI